jgi:5,5'-dehydrodivanillate O-demethylase oxygenase subunit
MLSNEQNERLTRVGKGTPCGELLRRYWHPIYPEALLKENPVRKVRLLGEDLTLYRDRSGVLGLIAERCPHRSASLHIGIPEKNGLRCCYHGWLFNQEGRCLETPLEPTDSPLKRNIKILSYPVQSMGGLIWAYLGPLPAPLLPRWDLFVRPDGFRQIVSHRLPCNWLQVMENRGDVGHTTYLHGRLFQYALERKGMLTDDQDSRYNRTAIAQEHAVAAGTAYVQRKPIYNRFGFTKAQLSLGDDERGSAWTLGITPVLFPYQVAWVNRDMRRWYQLGVPIDDYNTWHISYFCYVFPEGVERPKQDVVPYREVPIKDESGEYILDYVLGQDMVAWTEQGVITDRGKEHLGASDACVIAYRKLLAEQIAKVERGQDPLNVFREGDVDSLEKEIPGAFGSEPASGSGLARELIYRANFHKQSPDGRLYIDDDADRYCPDRDLILELFARSEALQLERTQ